MAHKLVKDVFIDVNNDQVKEALKRNMLERLWLMAMSVRDKKSVGQCGTILSKSAAGSDYRWGLRFYILLIECMRHWAAFTADEEINIKFRDLQEKVPVLEDDVYIYQDLETRPLDHRRADQLASDKAAEAPVTSAVAQPSEVRSSFRDILPSSAAGEPTEFVELAKYKANYLQAVFSKTPDVNKLSEEHFMYQSLYDSLRYKLNSGKETAAQKAEIAFAEAVSRLAIPTDIETPKGLAAMRGKVTETLRKVYGEVPAEFAAMAGQPGSGKSSLQQNLTAVLRQPAAISVLGEENPQTPLSPPAPNGEQNQRSKVPVPDDNYQRSNVPVPEDDYQRSNLPLPDDRYQKASSDLNAAYQSGKANFSKRATGDNKELNRKLKERKEALLREVEKLKAQERQMRESVHQRSTLSTLQKIESTPEVLIEEIERKNRAYENLQNKYAALMSQMKSKVASNLERSFLNSSLHSSYAPSYAPGHDIGSSFLGGSLYTSRLYLPEQQRFK